MRLRGSVRHQATFYSPAQSNIVFHIPISIVTLFGLIVFSPLLEDGTTHVAVMGIRLLILLLACLFLIESFRNKMVAWPSLSLDVIVAVSLGVAAGSVLLSSYKEPSLQWFLVLLSYAGLLYLFVYFVVRWEHISAIIAVLILMGVFESSVAIYQMLWHRSSRPTGTFFNPNFLAGYLASIGSIIVGLMCYSKLWSRFAGRRQTISRSETTSILILGSLFGLMFMAVMLTGSRAGLMVFVISVMTVVGIRFGWRTAVIAVALFLSVVVLIPNPIVDRIRVEHLMNPETYARWSIWHSSIAAIVDHPFGSGLGLYQYIYPRYAVPIEGMITRYGRVAQSAHNEYLQVGVELGIAGLVVLLCGIVALFREARQVISGRLGRQQRGLITGIVGATAGILLHAALDSNLHEPAIAISLVLCTGILCSAKQLQRPAQPLVRSLRLDSKRSRLVWAGGGIFVVTMLLVYVLQPGLAWRSYEDGAYAAKAKDYRTAIADYEAAIALEPGKSLYHSSLAASYFMTFQQTGDPTFSEATLRELKVARDLNPLDGRLWGLEGHVYRIISERQHSVHAHELVDRKQLMDWRALARSAYENALVLEPFNAMHYLELGRLHRSDGHREQALGLLRQAVTIEPNLLPAREWLVRLYLESLEITRAEHEYREIVDRRGRFEGTKTNAFEAQFLSVDITALEVSLAEAKGRI